MKIQKGILTEKPDDAPKPKVEQPAPKPSQATPIEVEKNRLFETLEKEESSNRNYAKLFILAIVVVLIAGGVIFYMTLPNPGDTVRAPKGLEQAVRDHLQEKQKRQATDITFFYCGPDSYWARAGVETRKDVPNPVFRIGSYAVTAKGSEPNWEITSKPVNAPGDDAVCK
ncbi:MAG TPA: hypothetical protein VL501_06455 [Pyrinomonadaceae bacterium]|nr:hypothetical protein [Pyrinomonadaceae bacterium]